MPGATRTRKNIPGATRARKNVLGATKGCKNIPGATRARKNVLGATRARKNIPGATRARKNILGATEGCKEIPGATAGRMRAARTNRLQIARAGRRVCPLAQRRRRRFVIGSPAGTRCTTWLAPRQTRGERLGGSSSA